MRIYTEKSDYGLRTKLAIIWSENETGGLSVVMPLSIKHIQRDQAILAAADTFTLDARQHEVTALLQAFLDHAWEQGLRPSKPGFTDTPEQIAAIKGHLADMRALVFKGEIKPAGAA